MEVNAKQLQEKISSLELEVTSYQTLLEEKTSLLGSLESEVTTYKESIVELEASVTTLESSKKAV